MGLLNYTTKIDADKTAAEIAKCLSMHGASGILTEYDTGILTGLSFKIKLNGREMGFRLPCDYRPVLAILTKDKTKRTIWDTARKLRIESEQRDQAVRTAWRIVKDWVEAQMALVETQMVKTEDVFLPYAIMPNGKTLAEHVQQNPQFLLGSGMAEQK